MISLKKRNRTKILLATRRIRIRTEKKYLRELVAEGFRLMRERIISKPPGRTLRMSRYEKPDEN